MAQPTIYNKFGKMIGWNSITVNFLGRDVEGISGVKYDDNESIENVYGGSKYPIGYSEGNYEATAGISLYREEVNAIMAALAGKRLQEIPEFDINVQYEMNDGAVRTDIIRNCKIKNNGVDVKQADGTIVVEFELRTSHIDWHQQ